jgi:amino acid permease
LGFAAQIVAARNILAFWPHTENCPKAVWIILVSILPILFNNFYVRRYGEFEFWASLVKVTTIVGLIILGLVVPMGVHVERALCTNGANQAIVCPMGEQPPNSTAPLGFGRMFPSL